MHSSQPKLGQASHEPNGATEHGVRLGGFRNAFQQRDYVAAERYWSPSYIQHSAHIPPGREGLFELVKAAPDALRYENGLIIANGDYVLLHGPLLGHRTTGELDCGGYRAPRDGQLAEHWDVIQDEASKDSSKSGLPMFGTAFPS